MIKDVYVDYVTGVFASNFGGDPGDYDRNNLRNSSIDSPHAGQASYVTSAR